MRLQTAPTGPGGNTELPKYFLKLHQTAPTGECLHICKIYHSFRNLFGFYAFFDEPERLQTAPTEVGGGKKERIRIVMVRYAK